MQRKNFKENIMAAYNELKPVKTFMGKLEHDADLIGELTKLCLGNRIKLGTVEALGAVKKARIGYYDQDKKKYNFLEIDKHLEIISLVGNVSMKDGKPIVHAHITLADKDGNAFGGHLAEGTIVFACEFYLISLDGPEYKRDYDKTTGLPLWEM